MALSCTQLHYTIGHVATLQSCPQALFLWCILKSLLIGVNWPQNSLKLSVMNLYQKEYTFIVRYECIAALES